MLSASLDYLELLMVAEQPHARRSSTPPSPKVRTTHGEAVIASGD